MSFSSRRDDAGSGWLKMAAPLVPLYSAGLAVKNMAYTRNWLRAQSLQSPVISIGNLSVGGAGKTPLVIRLAELLKARGYAVDVLSRGYGRRSSTAEQVRLAPAQDALQDSDAQRRSPGTREAERHKGERIDPERYGDEPILIAKASGVPVYVGASRYAAGLLAEQQASASARVHLLDDGFQHRQLARAVDIVVLHRSDFTAGLLPAGRLREPLSSLRRASVVVLRVEDADYERELRSLIGNLPLWWITREIALTGSWTGARTDGPQPAVAFCGIAHPDEFFRSLERAGALLSKTHAFRDHHRYRDRDIALLVASVRRTGAGTLLTTEKDLIRLSGRHRAALNQAATLEAIPLRALLLDEEAVLAQLLQMAGLADRVMRKSEFA